MRFPKLTSKQWALIFLSGTLLLMILLAGGMNGLSFEEGEPIPTEMMTVEENQMPFSAASDIFVTLMRGLLSLSIIILPLYIILLIFDKKTRKRLLSDLPLIFLLILALILVREAAQRSGPNIIRDPALLEQSTEAPVDIMAQPEIPEVPQGFVNIATVVVVLAIFVAIAGVFWIVRLTLRKEKAATIKAITEEVQEALDSLYAGGDLRETILLCYQRMLSAVSKQRNITRPIDMTPSEFGQVLVTKGLPARPVNELTHLFELVRYSQRPAGPKEHQQAIHSLTSIMNAIRPPESKA